MSNQTQLQLIYNFAWVINSAFTMLILHWFEFFQLHFPLVYCLLLDGIRWYQACPLTVDLWAATVGCICCSFLLHSWVCVCCAHCSHIASYPASLLDQSIWFPVGENLSVPRGSTSVTDLDGSSDCTKFGSLLSPQSSIAVPFQSPMPSWCAAHAPSIMLQYLSSLFFFFFWSLEMEKDQD